MMMRLISSSARFRGSRYLHSSAVTPVPQTVTTSVAALDLINRCHVLLEGSTTAVQSYGTSLAWLKDIWALRCVQCSRTRSSSILHLHPPPPHRHPSLLSVCVSAHSNAQVPPRQPVEPRSLDARAAARARVATPGRATPATPLRRCGNPSPLVPRLYCRARPPQPPRCCASRRQTRCSSPVHRSQPWWPRLSDPRRRSRRGRRRWEWPRQQRWR